MIQHNIQYHKNKVNFCSQKIITEKINHRLVSSHRPPTRKETPPKEVLEAQN